MGKTLTFEICDEIHAAIQEVAARTGRSYEAVALEWLTARRAEPCPADAEQLDAALGRLRRHAGAASLGRATGVDNQKIDADLAREYEAD